MWSPGELPALGPFKLLVTSDHATPVALRTHTPAPVPFALATGEQLAAGAPGLKYCEREAERTGVTLIQGHAIISHLVAYPE